MSFGLLGAICLDEDDQGRADPAVEPVLEPVLEAAPPATTPAADAPPTEAPPPTELVLVGGTDWGGPWDARGPSDDSRFVKC